MADSTIERALDWPARFGHTWLGSGIGHRGHSSQPVAAKRDKKQKAREYPGLVQRPVALRLRAVTSCLHSNILGALRSMLSFFVSRPTALIGTLTRTRMQANPITKRAKGSGFEKFVLDILTTEFIHLHPRPVHGHPSRFRLSVGVVDFTNLKKWAELLDLKGNRLQKEICRWGKPAVRHDQRGWRKRSGWPDDLLPRRSK